jgi:hypothetical protein
MRYVPAAAIAVFGSLAVFGSVYITNEPRCLFAMIPVIIGTVYSTQ